MDTDGHRRKNNSRATAQLLSVTLRGLGLYRADSRRLVPYDDNRW